MNAIRQHRLAGICGDRAFMYYRRVVYYEVKGTCLSYRTCAVHDYQGW